MVNNKDSLETLVGRHYSKLFKHSDSTVNWFFTFTGVNGVDGVPGAPGMPGYDGVPGTDGVDGLPGADGAKGARGHQGKSLFNYMYFQILIITLCIILI